MGVLVADIAVLADIGFRCDEAASAMAATNASITSKLNELRAKTAQLGFSFETPESASVVIEAVDFFDRSGTAILKRAALIAHAESGGFRNGTSWNDIDRSLAKALNVSPYLISSVLHDRFDLETSMTGSLLKDGLVTIEVDGSTEHYMPGFQTGMFPAFCSIGSQNLAKEYDGKSGIPVKERFEWLQSNEIDPSEMIGHEEHTFDQHIEHDVTHIPAEGGGSVGFEHPGTSHPQSPEHTSSSNHSTDLVSNDHSGNIHTGSNVTNVNHDTSNGHVSMPNMPVMPVDMPMDPSMPMPVSPSNPVMPVDMPMDPSMPMPVSPSNPVMPVDMPMDPSMPMDPVTPSSQTPHVSHSPNVINPTSDSGSNIISHDMTSSSSHGPTDHIQNSSDNTQINQDESLAHDHDMSGSSTSEDSINPNSNDSSTDSESDHSMMDHSAMGGSPSEEMASNSRSNSIDGNAVVFTILGVGAAASAVGYGLHRRSKASWGRPKKMPTELKSRQRKEKIEKVG